jgi:anaerobic selenocysteine-containing dehydrogenase
MTIRPTRHEQSVALGHSRLITPLSDKLVGYWRFEEASWDGTANELMDSSDNSNDGQMN